MRPVLFSDQFATQLLTVAKLALARPIVGIDERIALIDVLAEIEHQLGGYPVGSPQRRSLRDLRYVGEALNDWRLEVLTLQDQQRLAEMLGRIAAAIAPNELPF